MKLRVLLFGLFMIVSLLTDVQIAAADDSSVPLSFGTGDMKDVPLDMELQPVSGSSIADLQLLSSAANQYDVNLDGIVNIEDLSSLIDYLLNGEGAEDGVLKMKMQAGELRNGYSRDYGTRNTGVADNTYWNSCHTTLLLDLTNCTLTDVALQEGETLAIHWFDADCKYAGTVSAIQDIPSSAKYVRFQLSSSSPIASRDLVVTVDGTASTRKNAANPLSESDKRTYISYEVKKPYRFDTGVDYIGNDRLYDNGFILLPDNYSPTGEPTNLAVFIVGTSGYPFDRTNAPGALTNFMNMYRETEDFIALNNIAVCCCSGVTSRYGNSEKNLMYAPLYCESVVNLVDWVKANYNIGKIYLFGKSSGGILGNLASLAKEIGAVCAASQAPAFSPIASRLYNSTVTSSGNITAEELGIDYTFTKYSWTEQDRSVVYDNISKWRQFDGFFSSIDLTDDQVREVAEDCYAVGSTSIAGVMKVKERTRNLINNARRSFPCPHRVWVSKDDNAVSWESVQLLVEVSDNYSLSFLKEGGQHHSDDGPNAERIDYTLPDGTVVSATRAYAEMVDWFKCDGIESK